MNDFPFDSALSSGALWAKTTKQRKRFIADGKIFSGHTPAQRRQTEPIRSHPRDIIGAIAGWLAGQIVKVHGLGLAGNIVVGSGDAIIAGWLLPMIGLVLAGGILAAIINAVIGAVILLIVIGFFKK